MIGRSSHASFGSIYNLLHTYLQLSALEICLPAFT